MILLRARKKKPSSPSASDLCRHIGIPATVAWTTHARTPAHTLAPARTHARAHTHPLVLSLQTVVL